jgi:hypothetical protein
MIITKGENAQIKNKVRVPHVFQVFPEVSNYLLLDINTGLYSMLGNVVKEVIYAILEIYLSKKI